YFILTRIWAAWWPKFCFSSLSLAFLGDRFFSPTLNLTGTSPGSYKLYLIVPFAYLSSHPLSLLPLQPDADSSLEAPCALTVFSQPFWPFAPLPSFPQFPQPRPRSSSNSQSVLSLSLALRSSPIAIKSRTLR